MKNKGDKMPQYVFDSTANSAGIQNLGIISIQALNAPANVEAGVPFTVTYDARNDSVSTQTVFGYIWDSNPTNPGKVAGSEWTHDINASESFHSVNTFGGITAAFNGIITVGHITADPTCSPDGIFQCQGVDLYKCVGGNWVLEQANAIQCGYVPPVCTNGTTKCVGTTKWFCVNGQWASPIPNSTDCGYVEPCSPENELQCQGYDLFKCISGVWTKVETNSSVCGYVPPECTNGTTKCIGKDKYTCVDGKWVLSEANSSDCESIWNQPWVIPAAVVGGASIVGIALLLMRRK